MANTTIRLPVMNTSPPARKVSSQHLANLLNGLELMILLHKDNEQSHDLIAILTGMHNQMVSKLDLDAVATINLYKNVSRWFLLFLRGTSAPKGTFNSSDWNLTHSCPTLLVEVLPWLASITPKSGYTSDKTVWFYIQIIYAFLSGHRVIVTPLSVNTETITNPSTVPNLPDFKAKWPDAMKALGITPTEFQNVYKANCAKARFNIITSAGPNGQATWTADLDAKAILASMPLFINMNKFAKLSNLSWISASIVSCIELPSVDSFARKADKLVPGRIHAIEEWGGKTRVVAIVDYWTQALLTPLHDTVAYFIRRLQADGTFDQDKVIRSVQQMTADPLLSMNSYDLTAATDRIPIDTQVSLLTYLCGSPELPSLWKSILTDREFEGPDGTPLRYAVGQPMGAKSSFPMLSLIHHALIQVAAIEAKQKSYNKYVVLGDDNAHGSPEVASSYLTIMKSIGVPINLDKSIEHVKGLLPAAEICKRIFISGLELTAIPVKALVKTISHGHLASTLQNLLIDRGLPVPMDKMMNFFGGIVDRRSLQGILMLNKVPMSITGLKDRADVSIPALEYSKWFDNITVTDEYLEHAFLFALITEQLKRIDGLLRGTILMANTVQAMGNPDAMKLWPTELFSGMSEQERLENIKKLPTLSWSHPISLASISELDRVMSHLSGLRSGSKKMQDAARVGLLDLLRSNLSEIWMGEAEKTATVRRSIFNAMLSSLKRMNKQDVKGDAARALDFSLLLSHVQRMWSVHWEWTKPPVINAVKTKVTINITEANAKVTNSFDKLNVIDLRV